MENLPMEPKEIQTSTCEIETKIKCKINININNIDKNYSARDNKPFLAWNYNFTINFSTKEYKGFVVMADQRKCKSVCLVVDKELSHGLIIKYDLSLNDKEPIKGCANGTQWKFLNDDLERHGTKIYLNDILKDKLKSCNGWFEIEFKPNIQIERKIELKNLLYEDTFGSHNKNPDFTILCQDKSFQFNKRNLCFVSKVFQKMIESSYTQESKSDKVEIIDFNPEVVEAFNRVMFQNDESLDENDLTVELLMFANKYCVLTLVKFLTNHLSESLTMHNIYPVIIGAYLTDNDELLKKALKFIQNNNGQFQDNEDWKEFQKSHPQCFVKMMGFLMFQK